MKANETAQHLGILILLVWSWIPVSGCVWRKSAVENDLVMRSIESADRLMSQATSIEEVDLAIDVWLQALADSPSHPRTLGRLSKGYALRGELVSERRESDYRVAREYGLKCLAMNPVVAGRIALNNGRLTPDVFEAVPLADVDCLTWTAYAWGRALLVRPTSGLGLDLATIEAMGARAVVLNASFDEGRPMHMYGMALALPPAPLNPRYAEAREQLERACSIAPNRLSILVDLAELVLGPMNEADRFTQTLMYVLEKPLSMGDQLAQQAAKARAQALLEAGPEPRWGR